jgi:hypothetical protein
MNRFTPQPYRALRASMIVFLAVPLAFLAVPVAAASDELPQARLCVIDGTWIGETDSGARFLINYNSAPLGLAGGMSLEWIVFDPTLYGTFPSAVSMSQGMGVWQRTRWNSYDYTWIAYGLDAGGLPVYSIKTSGTGVVQSCDRFEFNYNIEVFPTPLDPLEDDPVACIPGTGVKRRVPLSQASCS